MALAGPEDLQHDIVRLLLERGADPNSYKACPPLQIAVIRGGHETVELLLKHGADPNKSCKEGTYTVGMTPLSWAISQKVDTETIAVLVSGGANVGSRKAVEQLCGLITSRESSRARDSILQKIDCGTQSNK